MAPKRKQEMKTVKPKRPPPLPSAGATRVTRSSTRRDNAAPIKAVADPEPPKKKKSKTTTAVAEQKSESPPPPSQEAESRVPGTSKTIIIEHCKQCNSFKTRAVQVKNGLEKEVAGVNVLFNPEKPRRGCFEIREESGEIFVSLLDLKRPFEPMKDLDMGQVISDIIEKIK